MRTGAGRKLGLGMVAILLSLMVVAGAHADRRMALVIGNSDYAVGPLRNPVNVAALMVAVLEEAGFEVTHAENLAYRDLQRTVVAFGLALRSAGPDAVGMVYYAGHAVQSDGVNYLIPVDADIQDELDLQISTLAVPTMMSALDKAGNRLNLVVLDACRNNPFAALDRSASRGLAKIEAASGTLLAYSTAPGAVAADGTGRNSPYTAALARAMRTPGLPVEQVFKRVRIEVMEKTGERQVPWESSSLTGDFVFIDALPETVVDTTPPPPDNTAEIQLWTSIAVAEDPDVFRGYLEAYPNGLFSNIARQRIATLEAQRQQSAALSARREREAEARTAWAAVKDSDDAALLRSIAERFGDTVYGELAQVKLEALEKPPAAAPVPSSVPQVAALTPQATPPQAAQPVPPGNPVDGTYLVRTELRTRQASSANHICKQSSLEGRIVITDGRIDADINESGANDHFSLDGKLAADGTGTITVAFRDWFGINRTQNRVKRQQDGSFALDFYVSGSNCSGRIYLTRAD